MKHKRLFLIFFTVCTIVFSACHMQDGGITMTNETQREITVRTEIGPIKNHFPGLPDANRVEWCSTATDGIGPSIVNLYLFVYLSDDSATDEIMQQFTLSEKAAPIDSPFYPEEINQADTWRLIQDEPYCFQDELPLTKKMGTEVYVNASQNHIMFIHAIGGG